MPNQYDNTRISNSRPELRREDTFNHPCDITDRIAGQPYYKKTGTAKVAVYDSGRPQYEGQVVLRFSRGAPVTYFFYAVVVTGQDEEGEDILEWVQASMGEPINSYTGQPWNPNRDF